MNSARKSWLLRLIGIPVVGSFAFLVSLIVYDLANRFFGGEMLLLIYPIVILMVWLFVSVTPHFATELVFAPDERVLTRGKRLLAWLLPLELVLISCFSWANSGERPYKREFLKWENVGPATVDLNGEWTGTWTDPSKNFTETISITLRQDGNKLSGQIVDRRQRTFRIIEATVSGAKVNIFYDLENSFRGRGATLLGTFQNDRLSGEYFAHDRPKSGFASKGIWEVTRVK